MNINDMTVKELIEMGAKVDINFHRIFEEKKAFEMINKFEGLLDIKKHSYNGSTWFSTFNNHNLEIEVAVFFGQKSRATNTTSDEL